MSTFLFKYAVFGPINSRRLGKSLGINILPTDFKFCNFNCVYCECGWTKETLKNKKLPTVEEITEELLFKIQMLLDRKVKIDTITFAGNGEPTIHPNFDEIISSVENIRDTFIPEAKIAVLNNATLLNTKTVKKGLDSVDYNICKLDAGTEEMWMRINQPKGQIKFDKVIDNLKNQSKKIIIQTLFLKGKYNGKTIDNTSELELTAWLEKLKEIQPEQVMIYSLDRDSPAKDLEIISKAKLYEIAERVKELGIIVSVA